MFISPAASPKRSVSPAAAPKPGQDRLPSANREAWRLLKKHAVTLPGVAVMAESAVSRMVTALPAVIVPKLASRCVTPAARMGLLAVGLGLPVALQPVTSIASRAALDLFCTRFMVAEEKTLTQKMAGQARLWKAPKVAAGAQQQLMRGNFELGAQIAMTLGQALQLGVDIGLGVLTLSSGGLASPALLCVVVGMQVFPVVVKALCRKARVRCEARVVAAERDLQEHLSRYWDNIIIGTPASRAAWQTGYDRHIDTARRARFTTNAVNQVASFVERLPTTATTLAMDLPYFSSRVLGESYQLVSDETFSNYMSLRFGVSSLRSAFHLVGAFTELNQTLQVRGKMQSDVEAAVPLVSMIQPDTMLMVRNGAALEPAFVLHHLDALKSPGRTTVRAPNGTGKTAFLSLCRQHFGDDALFLPAAHTLDFGLPQGSTGQTVMRILSHIDSMPSKPALLLLDEWDANLDTDNQALAQAMIERWSTTTSVVEVRNKG